ncbi:MAG: hypothetical protein QNJ57_03250 [Flavobacteriaceae bacterium]|nr:hypothetical protein [Flavobacteriaceae bacterium]
MKTTEKVKKAFKSIDISKAFATTKTAIKNSNEYALMTADEVVEESLQIAEKWQKVAQKAINGGFRLADNQQDLMFQALNAVKGQYFHGKKRFRKLFV